MSRLALCLSLVALVNGCSPNSTPQPAPEKGDMPTAKGSSGAQPEGRKLMLTGEPGGSKGVLAVRKDAKDGDDVVVVGRVGGSAKPFTEKRASFLIVDPSLRPTDGCETPWDFCEMSKKDVAAARLLVKFVDTDGKTLSTGARELFGLEELSTVVVKGKLSRDDKDNVVVVASTIFVRPEAK